jgi:hypothetical protein
MTSNQQLRMISRVCWRVNGGMAEGNYEDYNSLSCFDVDATADAD